MRTVELTLTTYLKAHNLTAYRLAQIIRGRVSERTVYSLARGGVSRLDLATFAQILAGLEELTGQAVGPADLLTFADLPEAEMPEPDAQTQEWQAAPLMPALEPYQWGEAREPSGEPVRYVPGSGFVTGKA